MDTTKRITQAVKELKKDTDERIEKLKTAIKDKRENQRIEAEKQTRQG